MRGRGETDRDRDRERGREVCSVGLYNPQLSIGLTCGVRAAVHVPSSVYYSGAVVWVVGRHLCSGGSWKHVVVNSIRH